MPEPMPRRQPQFEADGASADTDATRRSSRPIIDDPLEELARILGETGGYPARPETTVDVGRRANPARPMPQQLSALEAELFDELRASVTPDTRVRGDFEREITPPIPQRPADDRDIASLRIAPAPVPADPEPPRSAEGAEAQWSDFYAYDDGVAAGSYDPAFAVEPARRPSAEAAPAPRGPRGEPAYPHATFDEFGREEIAEAAREASPYVAADPRIMPHSREEERAAARLPHEDGGRGMKIAVAAIVVMLAGGGALAAWKFGGGGSSGEPVLVRADGKPLKTLPDPSKAPVADAGPTLAPDDPKNASRIVSKQEDPVDQVSGRTPEGKEVRLINPGAQRPSNDVPHTVKTVVVRPDGSIVSDGATVRAAKTATPAGAPPANPPAVDAAPQAPAPVAETPAAVPQAPAPTEPPLAPTAAATKPAAQKAAPPAPAAAVPPAPTAPQVKTVTVTPVTAPKPATPVAPAAPKTTAVTPPPAGTAAPMSLGPVAPKLASTPPPAAPVAPVAQPKPAAPPAAAPVAITPPPGGGGDFLVQISASGSEAEARNSFAAASRKYGALAGRSVDIQRADLGAKGVFYRARVPAGSREQAAALCQQLQAQGGQCMVVKR